MKRVLIRAFAIVAGLVLAWAVTLVGAELIRTLFGPYFPEKTWPAWIPTTPIVIATVLLWVLITGAMLRTWRRRASSSAQDGEQ